MSRTRFGPWLWGAPVDLGVFGGSALAALGLVALGRALDLGGSLPEWGWIGCVLAIDVAHVWATLFRTYLDGAELRRHPLRYALVPLACFVAGVALYASGPRAFWRVLAYVAVFHFVRQQVGWVALYRARAGQRGWIDRAIDEAATYAAALYPLVHWHAHVRDARFAWFVPGDFVQLGTVAQAAVAPARALWVAALVAFAARQIWLFRVERTVHAGKLVVVATTAACWWVGIVGTNSDFDFTVTNVVIHGVPYLALTWAYARARRREAPERLGSLIASGGLGAFAGLLLLLAFLEEMAWDRLIWHDREWLFGAAWGHLSDGALATLIPLLALPQAAHYVLDGVLWRRRDTALRPAQREAIGFV